MSDMPMNAAHAQNHRPDVAPEPPHLMPFLVAIAIFLATAVVSIGIVGLPH